MARLFFALWPGDAVRAGMTAVMDRLPDRCGRLVKPGNLHITLLFLGPISKAQEQCVLTGARDIRISPQTLILDTLGWWQRPQIIWLSSESNPGPLAELVDKLRSVAGRCEIKTDERNFAPHATLVRKAKKRVVLPEIAPVTWQVRDYCLVRADTRPEGARYEVIWTSTK
ncbi:MAG: RNA 2',3'-cyclic phosphodiesterase [Gammaproteobacteria bacterium]